jgi:hypothetical protein
MNLTVDQLKNLSFGYLCGADLIRYSAVQLLIKQYEVDPNSLQDGCNTAYAEIIGKLGTRYDLTNELLKKGFTNGAATVTVSEGAVISITITNMGTSYKSIPTISFIGGSGSGATAIAILTNGSITEITITNGGTGYTSAPTVVISGDGATNTRAKLLVKIASLFSIRNILGNAQNISEKMLGDFSWADKAIRDLRNGQDSLPIVTEASNTTVGSPAELINSSFNTLG